MEKIDKLLRDRQKKSLLRTLKPASLRKNGRIFVDGKEYVDFCSNDYLNLSSHPSICEASKEAIDKFGTSSSASRLLSGDLDIHHELEKKVASFKSKEDALVFNSGYQANVGIISALLGRGDVVFSDRLNHASIIDGILLSRAKLLRFSHNSPDDLESLIKTERKKYKTALIITESVFSMDGDLAPLEELVKIAKKYNCNIMVDEAHATGVFGAGGSGLVEEEGLQGEVDFIMGTFSKALGSFGAYLGCSSKIKSYLVNKCRSFIYSTALPPSVICANIKSIELVKAEPFRRKQLIENADYLRDTLIKKGFTTKGSSQIIPVIIGDAEKTKSISDKLKQKGNWCLPIRPPTVPEGQSRLRFSITYEHTKDVLDKLVDDLCHSNT